MISQAVDFGKTSFVGLWQAWDRFFFAPISHLPLGIFRFLFALNALVMYSFRQTDWKFYFTDAGFVAADSALEIIPDFVRPAFAWYPTTDAMAFGLHVLFLVVLLSLALGFKGRISALIAMIIHLAFIQRNASIVYGADIISTFLFFSLALSDNSRSFSLDAWLSKSEKPVARLNEMFTTVGVRLLQIQMCVIYGYTGLEKMKGATWWDGTAVWSVLGNHQLLMFDMSFLRHVPILIAAMTFSTLIFEVYFPVLVWIKPLRKWVLMFGVVLHVMIAFAVALYFFSIMMISTYFTYLDPKWLRTKLLNLGLSPKLLRDH